MAQWFTTSRISDNLEMTPEGFLLARNVPVARTGAQLYRHNELPDLLPNGDGWLSVDREPGEVFRDESIASFTGKPITNDHPFDIVTPDNWSKLAIGVVAGARRGSGANSDVLTADLLFTTKKGIDLVRRGKRALSVGYDASYEQKAPGMARQHNIIVNHLALVDEGRCGVRCTIVDGRPILNDDPPDDDDAAFHVTFSPQSTELSTELPTADPATANEAGMAERMGFAIEGGTSDRKPRGLLSIWHDNRLLLRMLDDSTFVEAEHPRGQPKNAGQFAKGAGGKQAKGAAGKAAGAGKASGGTQTPAKGEGAASGHVGTTKVDGKLVQADGSPLPPHIRNAKIPSAWEDVTFNPDPEATLLVVGKDSKGRRQALYAASHHAEAAAGKYARVAALERTFQTIAANNATEQAKGNPAADVLALIMHTGMRPGGEADTGADAASYGATNLEGRHVIDDGRTGMKLKFVPGKKGGQEITLTIDDEKVVAMLRERAQAAGPDGKLFPVTGKQVLRYVKKLSPNMKTKDFRTHVGTQEAIKTVGKLPTPTDASQYKAAVKMVAEQVAKKLGNTPEVALSSYISPVVFSHWQAAMGKGKGAKDAAPEIDEDGDELGLPEAHWGYVGKPLPSLADTEQYVDDDDEDVTECPPDVIEMLGFDPFEADDTDDEADDEADDNG